MDQSRTQSGVGAAVTFVSQYFWPEETATADMLSGIAFGLAARGMGVSAIAGQPAYRRATRLPRVLNERGLTVRRVPSTRCDKNRRIGRILNTVTFAASTFSVCQMGRRNAPLLAVTNPPLLPWVARSTKALRRTPYLLVVHDVYPQIAVALGHLRAGSWIERLWRRLNRWSYRGAARIIALGECMAEVLRRELPPQLRENVVVIPNWADGKNIQPFPRDGHPTLSEWRVKDQFVVQYSGNIGLFHEIETLVDAAARLRESNVRFVFLGDGGQLPWLRETVEKRGLGNVTLLPFQPKERLPLTLTACDAGLVTLKEAATGLCVPSKFYGILAAGKPVIAVMNERCEVAQAVRRHRCGLVLEPGNAEKLAAEIVRLQSDKVRLREMGRAARKAFDADYTVETATGRYADVIQAILGSAAAGGSAA